MGYKSPAVHRKCYEVTYTNKASRLFDDFRIAAVQARANIDAQYIYYIPLTGVPIIVWEKRCQR